MRASHVPELTQANTCYYSGVIIETSGRNSPAIVVGGDEAIGTGSYMVSRTETMVT